MLSKFKKSAFVVAVFAGGALIGGGVATADQGRMFNALSDLRQARAYLADAAPDKGGHRVSAIHYVDQAIYQTQLGIRAGRM